jgi:aspartyl-tRNA(Asn)/glutamyl-tRNA(Gln) amidotransferase subunit A
MGSSNENSAFGPVRNPHDPSKVPGGSSGGPAAAVASGMVMAALGSDTGGSIRTPASFCGVTGLRPTYGRVSRYGLVAFASSLDQIGVLAESPQTAAVVLSVIAGRDQRDSTSSDESVPGFVLKPPVSGLKIGIPKEYFQDGLDPEVKAAVFGAVDCFAEAGASVTDISLPHTEYGIATYYLLCTAEASSNLARYDGIRYGLRSPSVDLNSMYTRTRSEGFGPEVKRRIMLGTYVLSSGYYDAYYAKSQKVRTLIRRDFENAFEKCDVVIGPTSPTTAFGLGEKSSDPMAMYLTDVYTVTAPLAGLPAVSIPIGKDRNGMPIGLQITGKAFCESELLSLADWIVTKINGT